MRCQGHVAHGTMVQVGYTPRFGLYASSTPMVHHFLGPAALGSVNRVETCTSVCNLYLEVSPFLQATHLAEKNYHN